jgi:hypothetical protein
MVDTPRVKRVKRKLGMLREVTKDVDLSKLRRSFAADARLFVLDW